MPICRKSSSWRVRTCFRRRAMSDSGGRSSQSGHALKTNDVRRDQAAAHEGHPLVGRLRDAEQILVIPDIDGGLHPFGRRLAAACRPNSGFRKRRRGVHAVRHVSIQPSCPRTASGRLPSSRSTGRGRLPRAPRRTGRAWTDCRQSSQRRPRHTTPARRSRQKRAARRSVPPAKGCAATIAIRPAAQATASMSAPRHEPTNRCQPVSSAWPTGLSGAAATLSTACRSTSPPPFVHHGSPTALTLGPSSAGQHPQFEGTTKSAGCGHDASDASCGGRAPGDPATLRAGAPRCGRTFATQSGRSRPGEGGAGRRGRRATRPCSNPRLEGIASSV